MFGRKGVFSSDIVNENHSTAHRHLRATRFFYFMWCPIVNTTLVFINEMGDRRVARRCNHAYYISKIKRRFIVFRHKYSYILSDFNRKEPWKILTFNLVVRVRYKICKFIDWFRMCNAMPGCAMQWAFWIKV